MTNIHALTTHLLILLLTLSGFAAGQTQENAQGSQEVAQETAPETESPEAGSPEATADEAARAWLERPPASVATLSGLPPEELCRQLPTLLGSPAPPGGTSVNFDNRIQRDAEGEGARRFTYPVRFPNGNLEVLEVNLERQEGAWVATDVGVQQQGGGTIPRIFQQPVTAWAFALFSLYFVWLLVRPSFFRRWLVEGWGLLKGYRGLVIGTFVAMYGLFAIGLGIGANLPPVCQTAITGFVQTTVEELGAEEAYGSGNVARAAVVTLYQNFVMGTLVTTYSVTLITLGLGAYFFNGLRFLALGIPFGFLGGAGPLNLLFVFILIAVELSAYVFVTAGGGIFLMTVVRQGFKGFREGVRRLTLMLPIAFTLLVVGAWYEAAIIILPRLLGGP